MKGILFGIAAACTVLSIPCSVQAEDVTGTWHLARVQGESGIISPKEAGLDLTLHVYSMGAFHPKKRSDTVYWKKTRRHDRILQKFYDATYVDTRDGKTKKGNELSNGRISRNHKKDSVNLHTYRGHKLSKGHVSIRRDGDKLKPGSMVLYNG